MEITIKIFGLKEQRIIRDSWLTSTGIESETELAVTKHHVIDFNNEFDAMKFIAETDCDFEHGFEIIKIFKK